MKSVYEMTPTDVLHEIVVVDDGSTLSWNVCVVGFSLGKDRKTVDSNKGKGNECRGERCERLNHPITINNHSLR